LIERNGQVQDVEGGESPASEAQMATIEALGGGKIKGELTRQRAAQIIKDLNTKKGGK